MAVASATDMEVLGGRDHVLFGMVLFALVFIALIWFGEGYADTVDKEIAGNSDAGYAPGRSISGIVVAAVLAIVFAGPMFDAAMQNRDAAQLAERLGSSLVRHHRQPAAK